MAQLTPGQTALFEGRNWGVVATLRRDGSVQASTVWVDWDGECVRFNTFLGSAKERNLRRDGRATVTVMHQDDPQRGWTSVSGPVELREEGAVEHLDALCAKYLDISPYPWLSPDEQRVIVRVTPERVTGSGDGGPA